MRIGYIHVDYEEWTDGQYNVQEIGLAKAFEELGHETVIVYWVEPKSLKCNTEKKITDKIKKVYLPTLHFRHHVIYNCNYLKRLNLDLIHIQSDNLFYVPQLVKWCRKNHIPHYCYVGTIESSNPSKIQRMLMNLLVRRNIRAYRKSIVFVKTPEMINKLRLYDVNNVIVAPVGLDFSIIPKIAKAKCQVRDLLGLDKDKQIILCVCALRLSKSPMDIFKLRKYLKKPVQIVFIGTGPMRKEFEKYLAEEVNDIEIRYIPQISNIEIHNYYYAADYFVNFNSEEIFGMAILEAMYQGCMIIARKAPGPNYILKNKKNGKLCDSVKEMANIINNNTAVIPESQDTIEFEYSWKSTAQKILSLFISS